MFDPSLTQMLSISESICPLKHWSSLLKVVFNLSEIIEFAPDYDILTHILFVCFFFGVKYA